MRALVHGDNGERALDATRLGVVASPVTPTAKSCGAARREASGGRTSAISASGGPTCSRAR